MEEYTNITRTNKLTYKCGVCGRYYNDIKSRMECEQACIKRQEDDAKKLAEEAKKIEQERRKNEVDAAIEDARKLKDAYIKDYGSYEFKHTSNQNDDTYPYLWHLFF